MFRYKIINGEKTLVGINDMTGKDIMSTVINNGESVSTPYATLNDLLGYASKQYVNQKFGTIDFTSYVTEAELEEKVNTLLYGTETVEDVMNKLNSSSTDVTLYFTKDITTEGITIPANKNVILDLGGNNLEGDGANVLLINGNVTLKNGTVSGSSRTIVVQNGGSLTLDGATVISTGSNAIGATGEGSTVTINSGDISAQEYGVNITDGANAVINGGYIVGNDNFAVGGNGSKRLKDADHDQLPINVTINGGRLEGQIQSPGYIATAIYWPNAGTLTINGGEILGQTGIVQRAGNIIINEGAKITANGAADLLGKAGDSRIVVGPHAIVVDKESNYPNSAGMSLTVNHGAQLISENGDEINTIPADYTTDIIDNR